ncbi:response regulator transcription factor [Secundilactobacillus yichangensis]|uniref:response regulator transcription factor n=1 Tax=Secundilactobacillus yichangensis TaxID=2799580 RepID=UPI001944EB98|nr:response regulator transcription factor [Secundilactobacillus yichangensis]
MKVTILLVEDEEGLRSYIRSELVFEDYEVIAVSSGEDALAVFNQRPTDISLIILDWMLPGVDGLGVIRRIRKHYDVPIMMMTARDYVGDKVSGLDAGADDYITKPFETEELLARIRVILRHATQKNISDRKYRAGSLSLDTKTRQVFIADNEIQLTQREFDLLLAFMQHQGEVLTRDDLLDLVWGTSFEGQINIVDVYVRYLRNKLKQPAGSQLIQTVRGVGYRLKENEDEA